MLLIAIIMIIRKALSYLAVKGEVHEATRLWPNNLNSPHPPDKLEIHDIEIYGVLPVVTAQLHPQLLS